MAIKIVLDPITRLEGHLKIEVSVDSVKGTQQVVDAWATGTLYRGFETMLINRDPLDAQHFAQRICGVCPVPHGMAAVMALDKALQVTPPSNARTMRNLVLGANFIQSHILHFYHLTLPDFIDGPAMPPWQPSWKADKRFDSATTQKLIGNYVKAIDMTRKANEMGAIFGGRMPDPPTYIPGGFTSFPKAELITKFRAYLNELIDFITNSYMKDAENLAQVYGDYKGIGRGYGNLLAFGVFDQDDQGRTKLFRSGRVSGGAGTIQPVDTKAIFEEVSYSWYNNNTNHLTPDQGETIPQYPKTQAYSWMKAPRYLGNAYEVGSLARMWINGNYRNGISVMDRHQARAKETLTIGQAMSLWLGQLKTGQSVFTSYSLPSTAQAYGLTEAPRGALGHWLEISNRKISHYQIVTPTCWNASPRDSQRLHGPIEEALIGTPVKNISEPVEVLRVIHSFDPCLSCAVHIIRPGEGSKVFHIG